MTSVEQLKIINTRPQDIPGILALIRRMYERTHPDYVDYYTPDNLREHMRRFAEGQFVALIGETVVGFAVTMRTSYSPSSKPLSWLEAVGDYNLRNHNPRGEWLYGVDFAVHPDYRNHGIGTAMYNARFELIARLNLKGFYAGGMLRGYDRYRHQMSVREYAERVMRGEIKDPTVTMQMNRGFVPYGVIDHYDDFAPSNGCAMLIVWHNPHQRARAVAPLAGNSQPAQVAAALPG